MAQEYPFYLAGHWKRSADTLPVTNPWDDALVGSTWLAGDADVESAIAAAVSAAATMRGLPAYERGAILARASGVLTRRREELGRVLAGEAGKPIRDALTEVDRAATTFHVASEEARRLGGEVIPLDLAPHGKGRFAIMRRFPLGPVSAISPFNFPLNLSAHKLAPAVAAGNPIVLKPATVEIHATDSGFADEVQTVQIAPDCDAGRQFLPEPAALAGCSFLADRGYPSVPYFEAVAAAGGSFIVRLTSSYGRWVRAAWVEGRAAVVPPRLRLSRMLAQHPGRHLDLDVEFARGARRHRLSRHGPPWPRPDDDATVHESAAYAVLRRPGCTALPRSVAERTLFQGVDIVRESAHVQHGEPARGRGTHVGEPVRSHSQTLSRPATRRTWDRDLDAARRDVRAPHAGGPRRGPARRDRSDAGTPTGARLPPRERTTSQRRA